MNKQENNTYDGVKTIFYAGDKCDVCGGVLEAWEMRGEWVLSCPDCDKIFNGTQSDDLTLLALPHFTGSESYARVMGALLTDGVQYLMRNGYSWFVTDFLAVAMHHKAVKGEQFCSVELIVDEQRIASYADALPTAKALMRVTDGNTTTLYVQSYEVTSAKVGFKLFFTDGVLMLAGEY